MKRVALRSLAVVCWASLICAQEACDQYVGESCDGDAQSYECVNVKSYLTSTKGGEHTQILQDFCFKQDSPLFNDITVAVDKGTVDFTSVQVGDEIGELMFDVLISSFGETCPLGDNATLRAPIAVTNVSAQWLDLEVKVTEASIPLTECILRYNPADDLHNKGLILEGSMTARVGGGFELVLSLAELAAGATYPGLEYGDLAGTNVPVPLYFLPLTKSSIYTLPPAGGTLTVETILSAINQSQTIVDRTFLEEFTITPGIVIPRFIRGEVNADGKVDIADAIALLGHLFAQKPAPVCPDAADANDDGALNIADAIKILGHLFASAGPLPPPFPSCGQDPTDTDTLAACIFPTEKCP